MDYMIVILYLGTGILLSLFGTLFFKSRISYFIMCLSVVGLFFYVTQIVDAPNKFAGRMYYVDDIKELPDKSLLLSYHVNKESSYIAFWLIDKDSTEPKSFAVPYDKKLVKKLERSSRERKRNGGYLLLTKDGKLKGRKGDQKGNPEKEPVLNVRVIKPQKILPKN